MENSTKAVAELPWYVRHDDDGMTHEICSAANWQIAVIKGVGTLAGDACDRMNAEHIVKCVNEYAELVRIVNWLAECEWNASDIDSVKNAARIMMLKQNGITMEAGVL